MKIAIIGGGALGLLFSYYLSSMHEVHLYTRTKKQAEIINNEGLHIFKAGNQKTTNRVKAKSIDDWDGQEELAILTVKQYQLAELITVLKESATGSLLFLQNGYGHIKLLTDLHNATIYVGSVEHGAARSDYNAVFHNGEGVTRAAVFRGDGLLLRDLTASLASVFPIQIEEDYKEMLIKKLVVNSVINPLTAVLRVKNGELLLNPYYRKLFEALFEECALVLDLHNKEQYHQNLIRVCEKTAENESSMYKDLENGRKTEIEAILGYLLEEAARKKIEAPLIHNYYDSIKGKEHEKEGA